jgi:nucleoside-diphosphate-sugar epimerase
MDVSRLLAMGWSPNIGLREGIARTVHEYRKLLSSPEEGQPAI